MKKIPATVPFFSDSDIDFILNHFKDILKGKSFLSMGKYGKLFEENFASYINTKYAVSCNSGTSALELIFKAIGVDGREVILPSNTFIATPIAVRNAGGIPVFCDCGDNMCLDAEDVKRKITPLTAAVTIVHIGGIVSNSIIEIQKICKENDLKLVEDAAQAHGSGLNGTKAGAFGTAAAFSFFSTKVMTTGEGGIVTTNDPALAQQMKSDREFGKVKKGIITNYHESFGYNMRMPEVSALLGLKQIESLETFIKRRREIAKLYDEELRDCSDIKIICPEENATHNYFKYMLILLKHDRVSVHKKLEEMGVSPSGYVYEIPLHKLPVFPKDNNLVMPKTEYLCDKHFCLPIYFKMTDEEVRFVASTFKIF